MIQKGKKYIYAKYIINI